MSGRSFDDSAVAAKFASYAEPDRSSLLALRDLIFAVADETPGVGRLFETLKWGQPAYLTPDTKAGSTIRLDATKAGYAVFVHCQTTLLADFRTVFPDDFRYEGSRAVHLPADAAPPLDKLRFLVRAALTYHRKRPG